MFLTKYIKMYEKLNSVLKKFSVGRIFCDATARVAELADALDLGSSTFGVWVRLPPRVAKGRVSKETRPFIIMPYGKNIEASTQQ